jgi:hypothetical protein
MKIKSLIAIACVIALMAPTAAFAQSGDEGYGGGGGVAGQIEGGGGDDGNTPVSADDGGSLPFTGAELGVLAAAGGLLVLFGFGLRRLSGGPTQA